MSETRATALPDPSTYQIFPSGLTVIPIMPCAVVAMRPSSRVVRHSLIALRAHLIIWIDKRVGASWQFWRPYQLRCI